jgi:uncharacterized protein (TIRG00374 family)
VSAKKIKSILTYTVFIGLGAGLLFLAFRETEWDKLLADMQEANLSFLGISFLMGFYAYIARGLRWNLMLKVMGHPPKRTWSTIHSIALGYFSNLAIPRSGEVFRCTAMYRAESVPVDRLLGTVLLERLVDLLMLILVFALGFITNFSNMQRLLNDVESGSMQFPGWIIPAGIILLAVGLLILRLMRNHPLLLKVRTFIIGMLEGLRAFQKLNTQQRFIFIVHTIQIWLMYFLMVYVVFFALPATQHLGISEGLFLMVVGGLGMVIPTPGGVGSYHFLVMTGLFFLGVEKTDGLSFATVVHGTQLVMTIVAGIVGFIFLARVQNRSIDNG